MSRIFKKIAAGIVVSPLLIAVAPFVLLVAVVMGASKLFEWGMKEIFG